ncbi:MAG: alpha/beta hydrolase [Acidobacteriota bacterium]|nr:alpha/beta hydrolase [Acidobacteriota bacterium]
MKKNYHKSFLLILFVLGAAVWTVDAQKIRPVKYPYPVRYFNLTIENKPVKMAYMDAQPTDGATGRTVILFHGKNFNGYYWKDTAARLTKEGFRVVVPDQIGWGKSDKPNIHYSFHLLAQNNKKLLDALRVKSAVVVGHSIGGMLAARFALMYPRTTEKLILENPIGLEDYRTFVPYASFEDLLKGERAQTYASLKKYQQTYYTDWKPEYEQYVQAQAESLIRPDFPQAAVANALTSLMAYEQPVVYEFKNIKAPTLLIIGQTDRTVLGKNRLRAESRDKYGQYPELGKRVNREISGSKLVEYENVGHIPHVQVFDSFTDELLKFIK